MMSNGGRDPIGAYQDRIVSEEDKVLFQEAVASARASALRAAYIMVWLSCAESLKRKFRELAPRDGAAARVSGEITRKETAQQSVDKYILEEAKTYGIITSTDHGHLEHVYNLRCVYGHPYETQPSEEQLVAAASTVINLVLSRPTKLRHGYLTDQVRLLTTEGPFLDDLQGSVSSYANDVFRKVDDGLHLWFLQRLWGEHEKIAADPTQALIDRRCVWFSRAYVGQCLDSLLNAWDVVIDLTRYPTALSSILGDPGLFSRIPSHAQDIVVGNLLRLSSALGEGLRLTRDLHAAGVLSDRHKDRFTTAIKDTSLSFLVSAGYPPIYYADRITSELRSYNWYTQNPAIEALKNVGPSGISSLPDDKQKSLGNNVLQSAQGSANSAVAMLSEIAFDQLIWPEKFVEGILEECFVNEEDQIRFKVNQLDSAIKVVLKLRISTAGGVVARIADRIRSGVLKYPRLNLDDREKAVQTIDRLSDNHEAARAILEPLRAALLNLQQVQNEE